MLAVPRVSDACSILPPDFSTVPQEAAIDSTPPAAPVITGAAILRRSESSWCGISGLTIFIEPGADDRTPSEQLGYAVRLVSGGLPGLQAAPDRARDNRVFFQFSDSDGEVALNATFELRVIDLAGNESEPSAPVRVHAEGTGAGCSFSGGSGETSAGALLAALALMGRRRSARGSGR